MKIKKSFLLLLITAAQIFAQQNDFPKISLPDFKDLKITRESYFDGSALWGYINGGADIFLEYGFDKLMLQEIEWQNFKFKIELYRMNDPKSAFGIYSVSHYKCERGDSTAKFICITPYQIQSAVGKYYVNIINSNGSEKEQKLSLKIFQKIFALVETDSLTLLEFFRKLHLAEEHNSIKYMKGPLGIQNGLYEWYDRFENLSGYEIFVMPAAAGTISLITFNNEADTKTFLYNYGIETLHDKIYYPKSENGNSTIAKLISAKEIIFAESESKLEDLEEFVKKILQ
ncbi:MAG: hypothetical protein HYS25_03445 [Ignavibacteriales bacterium]|nr:hypothetical protein [Ignavibacteriales bacterium]